MEKRRKRRVLLEEKEEGKMTGEEHNESSRG